MPSGLRITVSCLIIPTEDLKSKMPFTIGSSYFIPRKVIITDTLKKYF